MPLFRRQSEKGRKRQQHQELLAQSNPEPNFDLSDCELQEVPPGVYAICKVLQKEALFLHNNWLSSLNGGGSIADLCFLRILDVHSNELKTLPDAIGHLGNLQVLNCEANKMKRLPFSIGQLCNLQSLNIKSNRLKELPCSLCDMPCLRLLDISENDIAELPRRLAHVRTLETLQLDAVKFRYPINNFWLIQFYMGICQAGTESIMKFLCKENSMDYQPPSKFLLETLQTPKVIKSSQSDNSINASREETSCFNYRRVEVNVLSQQMEEENRLQRELAALAAINKKNMILSIAQHEAHVDQQMVELSSSKAEEHRRFLETLNTVEKRSADLISSLLDVTEKARKTEALLDEIERDRMEEDSMFFVRWEEYTKLRKQEAVDGMNQILAENRKFEDQRIASETERRSRGRQALQMNDELTGKQVQYLFEQRDKEQRIMMDTLTEQEALQKQAVEALMLSRDAKHSRITEQIVAIEAELTRLSVVEIAQRMLQADLETNVLAEKRIALSALLSQFLDEKRERQADLKCRLAEMEQRREDGQVDYWLVQYQRLMDRKPQVLVDKECKLDAGVRNLLVVSGADDYIPLFARHRIITMDSMAQLTDADLKQGMRADCNHMAVQPIALFYVSGMETLWQLVPLFCMVLTVAIFCALAEVFKMGVHEMGLRRAILMGMAENSHEEAAKAADRDEVEQNRMMPSAPPSTNSKAIACPEAGTSQPASLTARGINSECVVCLDRKSEIIFLPCGHVCSCSMCSAPLAECPLCRAGIQQQVRLTFETTA